jgi:hypothetical protein
MKAGESIVGACAGVFLSLGGGRREARRMLAEVVEQRRQLASPYLHQ